MHTCSASLEIKAPIHLIVCVVSLRSCPGRACLWAERDIIDGFTVVIFDTFHTNTTQSFKLSHLYLYSTLYNSLFCIAALQGLDCKHYITVIYKTRSTEVMYLLSSLLWLSVSSWKSRTFLCFFFLGSIKSSSSCVSDGSVSIFSSFWKFAI